MDHNINSEVKSDFRQQISFGSTISLNLQNAPNMYLHCNGFNDSFVNVKDFTDSSVLISSDFDYGTFKIIPFTSESNFKSQQIILNEIANRFQFISNAEFKYRKKLIQEQIINLEVELNSMINVYKKLRGTPLQFETSEFQLLHIPSLRYLSLDDSNKNTMKFELVDFPNKQTFLKFLPTLKIQKLRNNIVFDQDPLIIASAQMIFRRNSYMFCNYPQQNDVMANIVEKSIFKINFYETLDNEMANYIQVGDAVQIKLAEKKFFLTGTSSEDIIQKILLQIQQLSANSDSEIQEKKSALIKEQIKLYENQYTQGYKLVLMEYVKENFLNKANFIWKIENVNIYERGIIQWQKPYRIKHFASGLYLNIKTDSVTKPIAI